MNSCSHVKFLLISRRGSITIRSKWTLISQVTMGDTHVTLLSVHIPSNNHLTSGDQSHRIRNIRVQKYITDDFNGYNYLWDSRDFDTRGEVIERYTDKQNLCILNDGTHIYLISQAQHVNKQTSAYHKPHNLHTRVCKAVNDCILRVTTIPKKSNPWFDEECREALKASRSLDKIV